MFPIKNGLKRGDVLLPLLFSFALVYAIRRIQVNQKAFQLNGTRQPLVFADDVNVLGGKVHTSTIKKNIDASLLLVRRLD